MRVDVKAWPTKQEAAVQLAISPGGIERLVKQKQLKTEVRHDAGQPVVVIDPDSIAEYRQAARTSVALARVTEPAVVATRALETAFLAFLQSKTAAQVPVERRIFLTIAEAAEFSGLPAVFLRRLIASGKLKALRTGAGWRVSRAGLEGLSETLTSESGGLTEHELRDMELNRLRRQGIIPESGSSHGNS